MDKADRERNESNGTRYRNGALKCRCSNQSLPLRVRRDDDGILLTRGPSTRSRVAFARTASAVAVYEKNCPPRINNSVSARSIRRPVRVFTSLFLPPRAHVLQTRSLNNRRATTFPVRVFKTVWRDGYIGRDVF